MSTTTEINPANNAPQQTVVPAMPTNVTNLVLKQVQRLMESRTLFLPVDYSVENALKAAWFFIQNSEQKDKILACTPESQANSLYDMVIQGLDVSKKQGYFIPYGPRLLFQRSYFGDILVAQRVQPGITAYFDVIYEGEPTRLKKEMNRYGYVTTIEHEPSFPRKERAKIIGAYCGYIDSEGINLGAEVMSMEQIENSWKKSKARSASSFHAEQPDQACKRTVIRRRSKIIYNASTDAALLASIIRQELDGAETEMAEEVAANANQGTPLALSTPAYVEPAPVTPSEPTETPAETPPGEEELF